MTKFENPFLPSFDLVVTRHQPLAEWLIREGHIHEGTPVVEHAHADARRAKVLFDHATGCHEVVTGRRSLHVCEVEVDAIELASAHNAANIRGKHVLGVLPHHLSAHAASITEVQLDWKVKDREAMQRGDLDVEAVDRAARGLHTYEVTKLTHATSLGVALARAIKHTSAYDCRVNFRVSDDSDGQIIQIDEVTQQMSADVRVHDGAWRPNPRHSDPGGWQAF